jgi:hypothetical protein
MAGPTRRPFAKAFTCAGIAFVAAIGALFAIFGPPGPAGGEAIGRLFAAVMVPALITGFFAHRSAAVWPLWRIAVTFIAIAVIVAALTAIGGHRA